MRRPEWDLGPWFPLPVKKVPHAVRGKHGLRIIFSRRSADAQLYSGICSKWQRLCLNQRQNFQNYRETSNRGRNCHESISVSKLRGQILIGNLRIKNVGIINHLTWWWYTHWQLFLAIVYFGLKRSGELKLSHVQREYCFGIGNYCVVTDTKPLFIAKLYIFLPHYRLFGNIIFC